MVMEKRYNQLSKDERDMRAEGEAEVLSGMRLHGALLCRGGTVASENR